MNVRAKISNRVLGIILKSLFRPNASPQSMRNSFDWLAGVSASRLMKKYPGVEIVPGRLGGSAIETIRTKTSGTKTLLYLHGGGYFMGGLHSYRRNAMRLAHQGKLKVIVLDYRLAPENPFPAALDDSISAYRELIKTVPPSQIILGGDSAGGGLVLATLLRLRDEKSPLPAGAFCLSPYADLTASSPLYEARHNNDVWLTRAHIEKWVPYYAGKTSPNHPYLSPVFGDYIGFPKMLILIGDGEVLFEDAKTIARKCEDAGVPVTLEVGVGMQHNWIFSLPFLPESKAGMKAIAHFVATC